ncbi:MAG: L-2-amino-thiazoline-4-carboxylic acid hydrolase [Deltaproteobacteria bacterium]|nr:MAG: L-2-amino-thiazoline-4-carboxylic acid hydrolase [Deltaproteobacteria bacterium]
MHWVDEEKKLTEQLQILRELRKVFGEEVIEIASKARLAVHREWMKALCKGAPSKASEVFEHSAFSVTAADSDLLVYDVLEDSRKRFAVRIRKCKYADFYKAEGSPEIGYAMHCALDFGEAEAYWPGVSLTRTKTLMQGDDCCNHCYEFKK